MATTLYLRDAASDISRGTNDTRLDGTAQWWVSKSLSTSRGSTAVDISNYCGSSTSYGNELGVAGTARNLEFLSPPLDADVTVSSNVTFNIRANEDSMSANATVKCVLDRIDSTGAVQNTGFVNSSFGTELTTSEAAKNWSASPTSTTFHKGDRIRLRVAWIDATSVTMASYLCHVFVDGPTGSASGDSYITFTETLGFLTSAPSGTTLYLTDTASAVSTAAVDREAWTSRGAGVANDVTNTATGPTNPIQVTDTAGGTVVDWWTKQLQAVTLGGRVDANIRAALSALYGYAVVRVEVAVCASDGSSPVVWAAANETYRNNMSEEARTVVLSGDDVSVTAGQRLRIRLYIDDGPYSAGNVSSMVTGYTVTTYYAGSAGATGDTYLTFPVTLTEYVSTHYRHGFVLFQDPGIM